MSLGTRAMHGEPGYEGNSGEPGYEEMVSLGMKVMVSRRIKNVQTNDHSFEST